jgi:hypothetical protein
MGLGDLPYTIRRIIYMSQIREKCVSKRQSSETRYKSLEPVIEYGISLIQHELASLAALSDVNKLGLRKAKYVKG